MEHELNRDTYPNPFSEDGQDIRVYTKTEEGEQIHMPSVTTILETRDDDKSNLYAWQDRNDGEGDNAYHKHLFWYSRHIGTLGHWHALHTLDNTLDWSEDEAESAWILNNIDTITDDSTYTAYSERLGREFEVDGEDHPEIQDASPREVLYSIYKSQHGVETWGEFYDEYNPHERHDYYTTAVLGQAQRDIEFFVDGQQRLWSKLGIDAEDSDDSCSESSVNRSSETSGEIIAVEKFLFNEEYKYAGQVDLVYEDAKGNTVVADLKSSSGCYDKHQMQGAAYGKAIEMADDVPVESVDRLEVHRAHPRSGQMAVHTHRNAPGRQDIHTTQYWRDGFDSQWQSFESLTSNFDAVDFTELEGI